MPGYLSEQQIQSFHDNGFLLIPDFWSQDTVAELKEEINEVINSLGDLMTSRSIFTTANSMQGMNRDKYFLESGIIFV